MRGLLGAGTSVHYHGLHPLTQLPGPLSLPTGQLGLNLVDFNLEGACLAGLVMTIVLIGQNHPFRPPQSPVCGWAASIRSSDPSCPVTIDPAPTSAG